MRRNVSLVPADGFYEWTPAPTPKGKKQPHFIEVGHHDVFAFAGLWESWHSPVDGTLVEGTA